MFSAGCLGTRENSLNKFRLRYSSIELLDWLEEVGMLQWGDSCFKTLFWTHILSLLFRRMTITYDLKIRIKLGFWTVAREIDLN
jgi:hypothetical protein